MNELSIPIDGPGPDLAHEYIIELVANGFRIRGQSVRKDGMPMLHVIHMTLDEIEAEALARRITAHYQNWGGLAA